MKTPGQHFLLSTAARTLSLAKVMRLSDDEAFDTFKVSIRTQCCPPFRFES